MMLLTMKCVQQFLYWLFISDIQLCRGGFDPMILLNLHHIVCLSKAWTWMSFSICHNGFFLIYLFLQWFELRGWYWWHCWTSLFVYLMVFNATFNNISVILWRSVLLVEETGGPGENHRPVASHWQTLLHNVVHLSLIQHHILNCYYGINTHLRPHTMKSNAINVSNINKDNTEEYYTYCFLNLRRVWRYQRCY